LRDTEFPPVPRNYITKKKKAAEIEAAEAKRRAGEETRRKQWEINFLIVDANAAFDRESPDYNEAFSKYQKAKHLGSSNTSGYTRFLQKARELLEILGECDDGVRDFLQKARQLHDTEEVRNELRKCLKN
jgi:hypothetical protein